jgi:hypothetical protein
MNGLLVMLLMSEKFNGEWSNFWAMVCHLVWSWKNKEKHDDKFLWPVKQAEFVRQRLHCYKMADKVMQLGINVSKSRFM